MNGEIIMPNFKKGDKVRRIDHSFNKCKEGQVYTVRSYVDRKFVTTPKAITLEEICEQLRISITLTEIKVM